MASNKENVVIPADLLSAGVVLSAGGCAVTLLPQYGGKIAQITANGHPLLQAPLAAYTPTTSEAPFASSFDQGDASGWDECLPSVADCIVETPIGPAHVPDHGDLWRIPWQLVNHTPDSATLRAECFSLPLELTRTVALREISTGWQLCLEYTLVNRGDYEVPWSWAAHSLFSVEPGDTLILPGEITTLRLEGSGNNRLGTANDIVSWPIANLPDGGTDDLRIVKPASTAIGDKLFAGPITNPASGWCKLVRPSANLSITIRFDVIHTPYLGLWICYGGWPDRPGPKQVCIAPEPTTAPVDSLAIEGPWTRRLNPGASVTWPVQIAIEHLAPSPASSAPDKTSS